MTQRRFRPGCYLNPAERKVVRITSPYWTPPEPEWVLLTEEVNATLVRLRELARQRGLLPDAPDAKEITWGQLPPPAAS